MTTNRLAVDLTEELLQSLLPRGSGFDTEWTIEKKKSGRFICRTEFHMMDEAGYYCGWQPVRIDVSKTKKHILSPNKEWICYFPGDVVVDYYVCGAVESLTAHMHETIYYALFRITDRGAAVRVTPTHYLTGELTGRE